MSVTVAGANKMMRGQTTEGSADSGEGVTLSGFYVPNAEVQARLADLEIAKGPFTEIALHESEGWTFFMASLGITTLPPSCVLKIGYFRREAHRFFDELPAWMAKTGAVHVRRLSLAQASGFLSLTVLYARRP